MYGMHLLNVYPELTKMEVLARVADGKVEFVAGDKGALGGISNG